MTQSPQPKEPLPIRLVFKLERAEHPRLYDDLMLAREGRGDRETESGTRSEEGASTVTNELFAPSIGR